MDRQRRAVPLCRPHEWWPLVVGSMDRSQGGGPRRNGISGWSRGHEGLFGEIPMKKKQSKRIVPWFATEEEEADWWYKNRKVHDKELLDAVRSGEAQILTREKLLARIEASKKKP